MTTATTRIIKLDTLTRVEGEGGIHLHIEDGQVREAQVLIYEPPRLFEAILRGRHFQEVPDITARICGICPVAYQMSAAHALENAFGVTITPEIRTLRRLMYCAEWIQSHALHIYLLQAPDFFGFPSVVELAAAAPDVVQRGLDLKKLGNDLLEVIGGRASHPVSVKVGGFHRVPRRAELVVFVERLEQAVEQAKQTVRWTATLPYPDSTPGYDLVALVADREYPMNEGVVRSTTGLEVKAADFESAFLEEHVPHSTSLHSVRVDNHGSYFVGPLARLAHNQARLAPFAAEAARNCGIPLPTGNPFHGMIVRAIELLHACEEALDIITQYVEPSAASVPVKVRAAEGCAVTEAPRGVLYHRYRVNEKGLVEFAKIVPPTAQNLRRMEADLAVLAASMLDRSDDDIRSACERLVRCYDPCISCSCHALRVTVHRR